ncbi:MAG: type I-E CRISPR-associated protein Cas5/CasD [Acidobacteria bacterium]|nr:type I-E CRISPR-associated protein Cas5/CasD [Acidobacteriota bacterium]
MGTLLIRLAGPMQSWGTQSRFSIRDTGLEPSKSGVVGLLCAALGKPRQEKEGDGFPTLLELTSLKMAVRVDRPGKVKRDFHTAGGTHRKTDDYGVIKADAKSRGTVVSERFYLSDANFLVGLESSNQELLERLSYALAHPKWQLCLGRKAFVPALPVYIPDGLKDTPLQETIEKYPWEKELNLYSREKLPDKLQVIIDVIEDAENQHAQIRQDVPISFLERHFTIRRVKFLEVVPIIVGGN